tara:strand:- start:20 stop:718 length:699 start_codon:yes stop_codon:yes gene_type:complete
MKIAFLIPSTSNKRDWKTAEDTHLWNILCNSLEKYTPDHQIKLFVGIDEEDELFQKNEEQMKFHAAFMNFEIQFITMVDLKGELSTIWNRLGEEAINEGYQYFKILGDDIKMPNDSGWLGYFINKLKKNNNIGWSAGYSNNDNIATQFLVHKTHYDIFGFFYPPQIPTWGVDDFLHNVYPEKYRNWLKSYPLLNLGGSPRYEITFNERFIKALLKREKPKLNSYLNQKSINN